MRHLPFLIMRFGFPLLALVALAAAPVLAQPATFSYQGTLADASGQPVADGSYTVAVRLFNAATGGTAFYAETHSVTTQNGGFSLSIGGGTPVSGFFSNATFTSSVWLEVAVGGTTLTPRTLIEAVPHARSLVAGSRIQGAVSGSSALSVTNAATTSGSYGGRFESYAPSGRGVYGRNYATTGTAEGVFGYTSSSAGSGVYGLADAASGEANGVFGRTQSASGRGVYGWATASTGLTYGVRGVTESTSGRAVYGWAPAGSGTTYGGYFEVASLDGTGVRGLGGANGVYGTSNSVDGDGVIGASEATSGAGHGVVGYTRSVSGRGVWGRTLSTSGITYAVYGENFSSSGTGVYGFATATSGTTYGVRGVVASPDGVAGHFRKTSLSLQPSALENDAVVIEHEDAVLGLYSNNGLTWGSAIAFGEVAGNGALLNKWAIARNTGGSGSLHFSFGTNKNYGANNTVMRIDTDGTVHADASFTGGGADFAEWLPLADASSRPEPGQLVGVTAGRVGLATGEAEQVMIVSSDPAFVGNPDAETGGALVALVGQAEVRLASSSGARVGDLLVASGRGDGTARAVAPTHYDPATDGPVAGRILELTRDGTALALVGVDEAAALRAVVVRQQRQLESQAATIEAILARLAALESRSAPSLSPVSSPQ